MDTSAESQSDYSQIIAELAARDGVQLLGNEPLSAHTTLRLGGTPRAYLRADTTDAVAARRAV